MLDFNKIVLYNKYRAWALENNSALEIVDGKPLRSISGGGKVWFLDGSSGDKLIQTKFSVAEE